MRWYGFVAYPPVYQELGNQKQRHRVHAKS